MRRSFTKTIGKSIFLDLWSNGHTNQHMNRPSNSHEGTIASSILHVQSGSYTALLSLLCKIQPSHGLLETTSRDSPGEQLVQLGSTCALSFGVPSAELDRGDCFYLPLGL
jgi:hypothetical protein